VQTTFINAIISDVPFPPPPITIILNDPVDPPESFVYNKAITIISLNPGTVVFRYVNGPSTLPDAVLEFAVIFSP